MHIHFDVVVQGRHIKMSSEREFLTKFLDLYRTLPCLWDLSSAEYKDKDKKNQAWQLLADVLKYIEPTADTNYAKLRIKHMRTAYQRELKKVQISKRRGATDSQVHVPNLWYYKLLTFLDSKDEQCTGAETVPSDNESRTSIEKSERVSDEIPKKKARHDHNIEKRVENIIEPEKKLIPQPKAQCSNSFAIYVSEQLDLMDTFQRDVAEKLISEVIFLAKTRQLTFDSKIESSRSLLYPSSSSRRESSSCSPPQLFLSCSPDYKDSSISQFVIPCPTRQDSSLPNECKNDIIRPLHDSLPSQINQASHITQLQVSRARSPAATKLEMTSAPSQMERNDTEPEGFSSLLKEYLLKKD